MEDLKILCKKISIPFYLITTAPRYSPHFQRPFAPLPNTMPRLGGLFSSSASSARSSTQSLPGLAEHLELEDAMKATMYILDDDMEKADMLLRRRDSAFHKVREMGEMLL